MVGHQLPTHMNEKKVLKDFRNTLKYHSEVIAVKKLHLTLMQDEVDDFSKRKECERAILRNTEAMRSTCQYWPEVGKLIYIRVCDRKYLTPVELDIIKYYPGCFGDELRRMHHLCLEMERKKTNYAYIFGFALLNCTIMYYYTFMGICI